MNTSDSLQVYTVYQLVGVLIVSWSVWLAEPTCLAALHVSLWCVTKRGRLLIGWVGGGVAIMVAAKLAWPRTVC